MDICVFHSLVDLLVYWLGSRLSGYRNDWLNVDCAIRWIVDQLQFYIVYSCWFSGWWFERSVNVCRNGWLNVGKAWLRCWLHCCPSRKLSGWFSTLLCEQSAQWFSEWLNEWLIALLASSLSEWGVVWLIDGLSQGSLFERSAQTSGMRGSIKIY